MANQLCGSPMMTISTPTREEEEKIGKKVLELASRKVFNKTETNIFKVGDKWQVGNYAIILFAPQVQYSHRTAAVGTTTAKTENKTKQCCICRQGIIPIQAKLCPKKQFRPHRSKLFDYKITQ